MRRSYRLWLTGALLTIALLSTWVQAAAAQTAAGDGVDGPAPAQVAAETGARAAQQTADSGGSPTAPTSQSPGASAGQATDTGQQSASSGGGSGCFLGICDPRAWLENAVNSVINSFLRNLIEGLSGAAGSFFTSLNFVTRTPPDLSYNHPKVQQYAGATRALANGLLAVVAMVSGFNVLLRPALSLNYYGATRILPRLVLGAILINTVGWWTRLAIDVNNAACDVFIASPLPSSVYEMVWQIIGPEVLLAWLIRAVLLILLVLQQLMRLALVDVLLVLGPLAALCWILPQTQGWASLWAMRFISTVVAQFVQMLALGLGFALATSLPYTGSASALLQPLLGIAVLAIGLKIPGLMGGHAGGNVVSDMLGTATGAAIGTGVSRGIGAVLGGARGAAALPARAASGPPPAAQLSLPLSTAVPAGRGNGQLTLPMSQPYSVSSRV